MFWVLEVNVIQWNLVQVDPKVMVLPGIPLTQYTAHFKLHNTHHNVNSKLYTIHCTLHTVYCTLNTEHRKLLSAHFTVHT
jgi:hypothetical protein